MPLFSTQFLLCLNKDFLKPWLSEGHMCNISLKLRLLSQQGEFLNAAASQVKGTPRGKLNKKLSRIAFFKRQTPTL